MIKNISISLSEDSINKAIKELEEYQNNLMRRIDKFTKMLAQEGVRIAELQVVSFPAFDTGELYDSIKWEKGDVLTDGVEYYVYTDCEYAPFVEFGTGIVGKESPHPKPQSISYKGKTYDAYDSQGHGNNGWHYYKNEKWHWTMGSEAKPFMYNTANLLALRVSEIAKECF